MSNPIHLLNPLGGGAEYTAGNGINIQNDEISVKVDNSTVTFNADGELQASTGTTYTAGNGISIVSDEISVKVDGSTVTVNDSGELVAHAPEEIPVFSSSDDGKVLGVVDMEGSAHLEWVEQQGGGGSSAPCYFVPFYDSSLEMLDTTIINSYGTYIEGGVGSRLAQYWIAGSVSQISINLPASVAGAPNDTYKATLSIQLVDNADNANTIWLVRNTENTGVGLGNIPPNYSYGNLSFNFTIGPRDFPYNYSIQDMSFRIEDSTNSSQTMNIPAWNQLNSEPRETWSRDTAGITLTQVPVSITTV